MWSILCADKPGSHIYIATDDRVCLYRYIASAIQSIASYEQPVVRVLGAINKTLWGTKLPPISTLVLAMV